LYNSFAAPTFAEYQQKQIMIIKGNIALSDNGFVFNPSTGDSFTLNNTGKEVIMMIKEGKEIGQITEILLEKYDADKTTIERYLSDFVTDLGSNNLMEDQL
jgi:hypothetical protein